MTEQDDTNYTPEEKLRREVHLALVALGLKMPTTEEEVVVAMRGHQLDNTPLPEHYRAKQLEPHQVRSRTQAPSQEQRPMLRPEHLPEL